MPRSTVLICSEFLKILKSCCPLNYRKSTPATFSTYTTLKYLILKAFSLVRSLHKFVLQGSNSDNDNIYTLSSRVP